jgi:AraC-like DNA-binding protein
MTSQTTSASRLARHALAPHDLLCRILYADLVTIGPEWNHPLCNPFWRLYVNDDDGATVAAPAGPVRLPAGSIVLLPAWGKFHGTCIRPLRHFYVHFDPVGFAGEWCKECLDQPVILAADPLRDEAVTRLKATLSNTPMWRLRMQALLLECLAGLLDQLSPEAIERLNRQIAGFDPVAPALRHIESFLHSRLPIAALAKVCGVSVDHFSRVFRARVGQTPTRYIQERRVAVAAERLIAGQDDITRIAADTGFANRYHFTRVFTNLMGVPPATYRRTGRV